MSFNRDGGTSDQKVTTGTQSFMATNFLRTAYTKYIVGNYFEKNLGDNSGTILANVNYQRFSTSYNSAYNELSDYDAAVKNSHSNYKTDLDAVFSEVQYEFPVSKLGFFSLSGIEIYKQSKYRDTSNPFYQKTNTLGASAMS